MGFSCHSLYTTTGNRKTETISLSNNTSQNFIFQFKFTTITLTTFANSALDSQKIKSSLLKVWPLFEEMFPVLPKSIHLVERNGPLGGGPLDPFHLALYSTSSMTPQFQQLVMRATGWSEQRSTLDYILANYADFKDPEQAYVDDIVIHELAHSLFGFGLTKAPTDQNKWWFSFGLGLLYDRMIWAKLYSQDSPLFSSAVRRWQLHFSQINGIDQKLINPDTTHDEKYHLSRLQIYGHGKALVFLADLRKTLGPDLFDTAVYTTIFNQETLEYDQFIGKHFNSQKLLIYNLEKRYLVR